MGIFDGVLIASDLDGTLLRGDHTVSRETRTALDYFMREGGKFSIATGRSPSGVTWLDPQSFSNAPAVLSNGGVIVDYHSGELLFQDVLSPETMAISREIAMAFPAAGIEVHCIDSKHVINRNLEIDAHLTNVRYEAADVPSLSSVPGGWLKVLFVDVPDVVTEIGEWAEKRYSGRVSMAYSNPWMLEIQNRGIDKAFGVQRLADILGIARPHIYTAGDAGNDYEMMRAFESFAPENATPEIKSVADHLLPSCEEHSIAAMIDFLKERYRGASEA